MAISVMLAVEDADEAIEWYTRALGATVQLQSGAATYCMAWPGWKLAARHSS
jgi:catechol 2,3-dioxygenase-like lactoylglutathione lyase family enzyme